MKKTILILIIIILICSGILAYKIHQNGGGLQGVLMTTLGHDQETVKNLEEMTILLVGSNDGVLADTIIVASYNPYYQSLSMLSIPRDTFIGTNKNYAHYDDKINSTFDKENPMKIMMAVQNITNIYIQYYVFVDTEILRKLVDELGGVWFDVPMDMRYDDYSQGLHIDLEKGHYLLNGEQAERAGKV